MKIELFQVIECGFRERRTDVGCSDHHLQPAEIVKKQGAKQLFTFLHIGDSTEV